MEPTRHYSPIDRLLIPFDQGLRTLFGPARTTGRPEPDRGLDEPVLDGAPRRKSVRLLRVDHSGEVCAQALYQGQALTAHNPATRTAMEQAAREEGDHLAWCARRIEELGGRTSRLNPLFYVGSLALGAAAGIVGDRWSLGFLAETERQVVRHLDGHLARLPADDSRSRAIVAQMRKDEGGHAAMAVKAGAAELPPPVPSLMRLTSRLMTATTYWI